MDANGDKLTNPKFNRHNPSKNRHNASKKNNFKKHSQFSAKKKPWQKFPCKSDQHNNNNGHLVENSLKPKPSKNKNAAPEALPLRRSVAPSLAQKMSKQFNPDRRIRDPRFDDLSGKLDQSAFDKNYEFVNKLREKERSVLKKELLEAEDPETKEKVKAALQVIDNQDRERKKVAQAVNVKKEQRKAVVVALREGKRPFFRKRSEVRLELMAKHFHALKKEKRVEKYLERKEKQKKAKELFGK